MKGVSKLWAGFMMAISALFASNVAAKPSVSPESSNAPSSSHAVLLAQGSGQSSTDRPIDKSNTYDPAHIDTPSHVVGAPSATGSSSPNMMPTEAPSHVAPRPHR